MNELIKIEEAVISNEKVNAVSARELHKVLGVGRDFSTWLKSRVTDSNFTEGRDFLLIPKTGENSSRGRPTKEYYLSLDMAKHLCMLERTPQGHQVREYFIECEKKLQQVLKPKQQCFLEIIEAGDDIDRVLAIRKLDRTVIKPLEFKVEEQAVVIEEQTQVIEEAKPKVQFYDTVTMTTDTVDLADAAKLLNFQGVGRNTLYKLLRQWKVIDSDNRPYQKYVNIGCFKLVQYTVPGPYGNTRVKFKTVCYQKGLDLLLRMLIKKGYQKL